MIDLRAPKLTTLSRSVFLTGGAQATVQLFGFGSGLLIIRSLSSQQYAYYTIATAVLTTMTSLADSGIGSGVLAQAGLVWQQPRKVGAIVSTGIRLRRQLALIMLLVFLPVMIALLCRQRAGLFPAIIMAASILPTFFATINGQLYETVPRLSQRLLGLQRIQLGSNVARLLAIALTVPRWPFAAVASIVTSLPMWVANWRLRRLARMDAEWESIGDPEVRRRLLSQLARTMPGTVYFVMSSQLTVWLASLFGHSGTVAAVGALGRLVMLLTVVSSVFSVMALPRFARLPEREPALIIRRFWQYLGALASACLVLVLLLAAFPQLVLKLIGPQYEGLTAEAILMALSTLASMTAGASYSLAAARGVVAPPAVSIAIFALLQIILIVLLPVHTVMGVIEMSLLGSVGQGIFHFSYFLRYMRRHRLQVIGLSGVP